ncbi:MAG TPA: response regulator transcription factor [Candidatus Limnocylindrales bacterium]|nr:response regulator transcription factor [Candidatus Limnocylindrales bacterium]
MIELPVDRSAPIGLVIADDSFLIRSAVRELVSTFDDVQLLEECPDADCLLEAVDRLNPAVVMTDIRMPPGGDGEGLRVADRLRRTHPDIGVIVLSQHEEPSYGRQLLEGGATGRGYLLKDGVHDRAQVHNSIRIVAVGGTVIDPLMVRRLLAAEKDHDRRLADLSPRELEVLASMAQGQSNATIAAGLHLTKKAVEKHVGSIFSKLELPDEELVSRRVAAVLLYLEGGR